MQNNCLSLRDNSYQGLSDFTEESAEVSFLRGISGKSLYEFSDLGQIFTLPDSRRNEIVTDSPVLLINDGRIVQTNNIVGFIGNSNTSVSILSRFAQGENDLFIQYMLSKVLGINMTQFMHLSSSLNGLDILPYLFPYFLKKAMEQGMFKPYIQIQHNDSKVKGQIKVADHIKNNIPFMGSVAYSTRERVVDNHITQLVRHTIEKLSKDKRYTKILSIDRDTIGNVKLIRGITPSFNPRDLRKVLFYNRKSFVHPYYTYYSALQKLCILILQNRKSGFGASPHKINGILIDVAWLWEEYLNEILRPIHVHHPLNRLKKGAIFIANSVVLHSATGIKYQNIWERYPDFYTDTMVFDAKYKFISKEKVAREDLHQLITYMHIMNKKYGAFISPTKSESNEYDTFRLNGVGGEIAFLKVSIPENCPGLTEFCKRMQQNEKDLLDYIGIKLA